MRTFLKVYFLIPGDGYSTARTSLNGLNQVCLLFSGSTAYVRNHAVIQGFIDDFCIAGSGKTRLA